MQKPVRGKRLKKGERKPRGRSPEKLEMIKIMMTVRGNAGPEAHIRRLYLERAVGKKLELPVAEKASGAARLGGPIAREIARNDLRRRRIVLPRELEFAPIHLALKRTFRSMVDSGGLLSRETKTKIRQILSKLYEGGKFSFKVIEERLPAEGVAFKEIGGKLTRVKRHIKALPRAKKKQGRERPKMPVFKIEARINFRKMANEIDNLLSKKRGKEFRRYFNRYLLEETQHAHWFVTTKMKRLVKEASEKPPREKKGLKS